jgi:hypothetical protein
MDPLTRVPQERPGLGRTEKRRGGAKAGGLWPVERSEGSGHLGAALPERPALRELLPTLLQAEKQAARRRVGAQTLSSAAHPCQRLLASPAVDEVVKEQLRQQFAALDPVVLLKTIRETQQELNALSDGDAQPPTRTTEDLGAFLDGLATAWQHDNRPPQGRRKAASKHWWRTRTDPFAHSWPLVENWLRAEPDITAKTLMQRLRELLPDVYPTGAQLRTLQRRVQLWRAEQVRRLIFEATAPGTDAQPNTQLINDGSLQTRDDIP